MTYLQTLKESMLGGLRETKFHISVKDACQLWIGNKQLFCDKQ